MVVPLALTSCLDDDDDVTYSDLCYVEAFSLGSIKQTHFTTGSDGEDSTYYTTYSASSSFPMTINQRDLTIENLDSLPVHSVLSAVLTSCTYTGVLGWRKLNLAEGEDTTWTSYSSSDSLDLTEPLDLIVVPTSGTSIRHYTLKVNMHQQNGDTTVWNSLGSVDALEGKLERKAFVWNNNVVVLALQSGGTVSCVQHPTTTSGDWVEVATTGTEGAVPSTLCERGDRLYMSTDEGQVLQSENAIDWTDAGYPVKEGLTLVAASEDYLYALCDGQLLSSDGGEWESESLDDEASNLPSDEMHGLYYTLANGQHRLLLVGQTDVDGSTVTRTWAKSWTDGEEEGEIWAYYTENGADKYRLPTIQSLNILPYDDGFIALGGASLDGAYEAMQEVLRSRDHGVAWTAYDDGTMDVDEAIQEAASAATYITCAVDDDNFLWTVVDNQVWRGRINRLGFLRQDPE